MNLCFVGKDENGMVGEVVPVTSVKSIRPAGNGLYEINFIDGTSDHLTSYSVNTIDIGMSLLEQTVLNVRKNYNHDTPR